MTDSTASTPPTARAADLDTAETPRRIIIRVWPNIPILYPMAIAALVCGIFSSLFGIGGELERLSTRPSQVNAAVNERGEVTEVKNYVVDYRDMERRVKTEQVIALVFLAFLAYSLLVVCTDIMLTWALLGAAFIIILALGLFILNIYYGILAGLFELFGGFVPLANAQFYFAIFVIWAVLMIAAIIYTRFHYVKIESNEVIVVGGMLDRRRRYSTMRMQYSKEVSDVFEYYLPFVRSGRLTIRFPNESEPIVINHVMQVDRVVAKLDRVASSLQISGDDDFPVT